MTLHGNNVETTSSRQCIAHSCPPSSATWINSVLMGAGEHRDRLGQFTVRGQETVRVAVGAQDVGQHHNVGVVTLGPGDRPAFAVAGHCHRVDGINLSARCAQGGNKQASTGLAPPYPAGSFTTRPLPASVT